MADGFDATPDNDHVEQPEAEEACPQDGWVGGDGWPDDLEHGVDGGAADPRLNAKPAAGDNGAEDGGDICAADAEGGADEDGKGNTVFCAGMGVEQHGDENDEVAEEDRADRLLPVHALGNEAGGELVGGDLHAHGEPESGVVVEAPGALRRRCGSEVTVG